MSRTWLLRCESRQLWRYSVLELFGRECRWQAVVAMDGGALTTWAARRPSTTKARTLKHAAGGASLHFPPSIQKQEQETSSYAWFSLFIVQNYIYMWKKNGWKWLAANQIFNQYVKKMWTVRVNGGKCHEVSSECSDQFKLRRRQWWRRERPCRRRGCRRRGSPCARSLAPTTRCRPEIGQDRAELFTRNLKGDCTSSARVA